MEKTTSISVKLANKAYIHLLTALKLTIESAIKLYTKTNPFTYNIAITITSRYTSIVFIGIMIMSECYSHNIVTRP